MAFTSFVGRVLFVSFFALSAYQEFNDFGVDGGPAARALQPKFDVFAKHVTAHTGFKLPPVEMKHIIAVAIALKGIGSLLFAFGSSLGAYLLLATPTLYDFYNYDVKYAEKLALFGALLFFIDMRNSAPRRHSKKKAHKSKTN